jgi:hypothetical protein
MLYIYISPSLSLSLSLGTEEEEEAKDGKREARRESPKSKHTPTAASETTAAGEKTGKCLLGWAWAFVNT